MERKSQLMLRLRLCCVHVHMVFLVEPDSRRVFLLQLSYVPQYILLSDDTKQFPVKKNQILHAYMARETHTAQKIHTHTYIHTYTCHVCMYHITSQGQEPKRAN